MNIEELPEADNLDISKSMAKDALLLGSDNILKKEEMILYDDACAVIPVTSKNQDMAARFLNISSNVPEPTMPDFFLPLT